MPTTLPEPDYVEAKPGLRSTSHLPFAEMSGSSMIGAVSDLARPELRIGDAERRACDEQLNAAVGAGLLTLEEYEARVGAVWSARTAGELAELVRDLPPAHGESSPPVLAWPTSRRRRRRA